MAPSLTHPVELSHQPATARRQLAQMLADATWHGDADAVVLAVHEAMVNSQRHGGGVRRATAGFDGADMLVEVSDRGRGFQIPASPEIPAAAAEHGRGLYLIRRLATTARVVRAGRDVSLQLRFAGVTRRDGRGCLC